MTLETIRKNVEMQLAEIELCQSMFSPNEFVMDDITLIEDWKDWLKTASEKTTPNQLSFALKITLDETAPPSSATAHVAFPLTYPCEELLSFYVKSDSFNRDDQARLNTDLGGYLKETFEPDLLIISDLSSWIQSNAGNYVQKTDANSVDNVKAKLSKSAHIEVGRLWLYSHHIYSKTKRKNILDLAKDNSLTGFCMPGKPGIVCLEGPIDICNEVWSIIKSWNWKKINVRTQESFKVKDNDDLCLWRKFSIFEEIGFVKGETRDYHMDMGEFFKYLQSHNCQPLFKELFGIDKTS